MQYKVLCFDLDGTIMKTDEGVGAAHYYALEKLQLPYELPIERIYTYIGPSNETFMREEFGMTDPALIEEYDRLFCDFYKTSMTQAYPYDGMIELMRDTQKAGYILYVCTAKNQESAEILAEKEGFGTYCKGVYGSCAAGDEKLQILQRLLEQEKINPSDAVMIGDRYTDLDAGRDCGTKTIGVTYGYAPPNEIENCKPDFIAHSVEELREYLLKDVQ